jgi:hypothetical protein
LTGAGLLLLLLVLLLVLLMALSPAGVSPYFFSMSSDELPSTCNWPLALTGCGCAWKCCLLLVALLRALPPPM